MHDPKSSASSPAKHMAPPRATPFSPKNHPKREAPQPMPATTLAKKKIGCVTVCHLAIHRRRPPIRAARVSKRYQKIRIPIASNANRRPNQCRRLCILLDPLECPRATPPPLTISTFRLFDVSTFLPSPPTHARHRIYNRKKSAVSLYVTFDVSFPRGAPTRLAVWRRITSPAPHRRASKKLS